MKESFSEGVLQQPFEKLNLLQLAFGEGTTKKALFSALVVGSYINEHQSRRYDSIRRISLLAESPADLFCTILCHNLGGHYR